MTYIESVYYSDYIWTVYHPKKNRTAVKTAVLIFFILRNPLFFWGGVDALLD